MEDYYWDIANRTKMGDYLTRNERKFIDSILEDNNISTCLDVACGSGRFSIPIFRRGINVVAIDYDHIPLRKLKNKIKREHISREQISIMRCDANELPFKKSKFDCIVSLEVVDYLEIKSFFKECNRVLRKNGILLFSILNSYSYKRYVQRTLGKYRTFYRYSFDDAVRYLNEAGFEVKKCTGYNWLPFKRNSNNNFIGIFEFLEKALGMGSLAAISPWVLFVALKREER